MSNGSASLSDTELIALILRTGKTGQSVLDLARSVLAHAGGLTGLANATPLSLKRQGLGPARFSAVLAALEIGKRLTRSNLPDRLPLNDPSRVANYLSLRYFNRSQEIMGSLYLDSRNRLIGESELYRGTLNRAAVEPRAVLKESLLRDAAGFVLFHTHPSGDPTPSAEDLAFTRRVAQAGEVIGVYLIDHLVVASGNRWVSMRLRDGW